jgi:hypothetical protein
MREIRILHIYQYKAAHAKTDQMPESWNLHVEDT